MKQAPFVVDPDDPRAPSEEIWRSLSESERALFAPDLIAVLDVEDRERLSWVVSHEGRGLDLALEIHVAGSRRKDVERNVARYARLGISEYFVFDCTRSRLLGFRLPHGEARSYEPIVLQRGRWPSTVLDLDLALEDGRLRFLAGNAPLLDARELIDQLSTMVDVAVQRAEEEARRAEEEARRADRLASRLRELGIDPDEI